MEGTPPGWDEIQQHLNDDKGWSVMDVDAAKCPDVLAWKKAVSGEPCLLGARRDHSKPLAGTSVEMIKAEGMLPGVDAEKVRSHFAFS